MLFGGDKLLTLSSVRVCVTVAGILGRPDDRFDIIFSDLFALVNLSNLSGIPTGVLCVLSWSELSLGSWVSLRNFETIRGSLMKPKWQKLASLAQEICTL